MENAAALASESIPTRLARLARRLWRLLVSRQELVVFILLLLVCAVLSFQTDTFLTRGNLLNITRAFSWIAIAALGQSLVIIIGGIDLSAGAVMALSGLVSAICLEAGAPVPVAIVAGLLTGSLVGLTNGLVIGRIGLPPIIVTLGTMSIARGLTLSLTGGAPLRNLPGAFRALGQAEVAIGAWVIPLPVIYMLILGLLVSGLLNRTVLGRYIYALGGGGRALVISGVNTTQLKVLVYTLCGLLTAVGGLLMTARVGVAAPTAAEGAELDIIAAAVIGGASLFGGEGSVVGVLLGAALLQVVRTGLVLLGVSGQWQGVAIGVMILLVILLDYWRRRRVVA
jgi:ribose transport system permease protein